MIARAPVAVRLRKLLGRTLAAFKTRRRLIQGLPGFGAINSSNSRRLDDRRIKVTEIDPHFVHATHYWHPVRYAATRCAPTQREALVTPTM